MHGGSWLEVRTSGDAWGRRNPIYAHPMVGAVSFKKAFHPMAGSFVVLYHPMGRLAQK